MAFDADAFCDVYLAGEIDLGEGWRVARVLPDRARAAISVSLEAADGRTLLLFVEPRIEGTAYCATTRYLQLSYYPSPALVPSVAAELTRRLAARLERREHALDAAAIARVLRAAPERRKPNDVPTLDVSINRECNERCAFCNTPPDSDTILAGRPQILDRIRHGRASGFAVVVLTGREPTLDPSLPDYLQAARDAGFARVRLQTNGTTFAERARVARYVEAGLSEVEISLHTRDPHTFERLVGEPSLLDRTLLGIQHALAFDIRARLIVVVTQLNLAQIEQLLRSVAADFGQKLGGVTLSPMAPVGLGSQNAHLVPRLTDLRRVLEPALVAAREVGLSVCIPSRCGLPLCATPEGFLEHNEELLNRPGFVLEAAKSKAGSCAPCRFEPVCTGVWDRYLELFGTSELRPVAP